MGDTSSTPDKQYSKSPIVKRSIVIEGHKTSVSLEDAFWKELREIASAKSCTLSDLVAEVDRKRNVGNLSSALRVYVLQHVRNAGASRASVVTGSSPHA